ncbi:MAG: G8 domain-containing protein, partial [Actinomycetota bacterium]
MPTISTRSLRRPALLAAAGALALSACASGTRANDAASAATVAETDHQHRADHRADHPGDHHPALALVGPELATHTAVASGDWSASSTWASGASPGEGSRVVIPAGIAVTVDGVVGPAIKTIGIDGTLRFAPDVDTELRVDTVVSAPGGTLEIGSPAAPIDAAATARLTFADDGPIDRQWDPALLSRGAVLYGTTTIHGTATTHRAAVASFPRAGDASITLTDAPAGWRAGDELVITGTDGPTSDEVRTITRVDGATIALDRPLDAHHVPPADDLDLYVANLSRNVVLSSENPAIDRRGHLMIAHTLAADIRGARFSEMGRTDKSRELDDVEFVDIEPGAVGWTGEFSALGGTNVRGRYSVHFHRGGALPTSEPAVIADSVVTGDPGWAFTNHSSHVDFVRNVAYDSAGAGFFTEAGDETGRWIDNIAIRSVMPGFT